MISFSQTDYYYYQGEKVYLTKNYQYVNIVTSNSFDETQLSSSDVQSYNLRTETEMRNGEYKKNAKLEFVTVPTNQTDYEQKVTALKNTSQIESVYPYYTYNEHTFGSTNNIFVKLKQAGDTTLLQTVAAQKSLDIIKNIDFMPLWYLITCNEFTVETPVEMAAYLSETGLFDKTDPTFTGRFITPTLEATSTTATTTSLQFCNNYNYIEPAESDQWNLFNNPDAELADINVCGAWEAGYFGQGVRVIVFDTGIWAEQLGMFDLPVTASDVLDPAGGMDFDYYYVPPGGLGASHDTLVASIIGSEHDTGTNDGDIGPMGGIAPQSKMLYVASDNPLTINVDSVIQGLEWASSQGSPQEPRVVNMSFGNAGLPSGTLDAALTTATDVNNMVIVAASGNDSVSFIDQPASHANVIAVGGSNENETFNTISNYGTLIDVVAPSNGVPTVGFFNDYGNGFGFTSAASPHVTGIASLMLSANPFLKSEAVRNIIKRTAQKTGDGLEIDVTGSFVSYNENINLSLGPWSQHMGYGVPNATESVLVAKDFETGTDILDVYMRNSVNDYGKEPDNVTRIANNVLWNSPDIWVPADLQEGLYENADSIDFADGTAIVVVRVINKSNTTASVNSLNVELYWSKLAYVNAWPTMWDGSYTVNGVPVGGLINSKNNVSEIKPGEQSLFFFIWQIPNPTLFDDIFEYNDPSDFSFLARIVSDEDPMIFEEVYYNNTEFGDYGNVWINAKNNNNIAWKNIEVINSNPKPGAITISNLSNESKDYSLEFKLEDNSKGSAIFEEAEVAIQMSNDLYQDWTSKGAVKTNLTTTTTNQTFKVTEDDAIIDNITLAPGEIRTLQISFNFLADALTPKKEFIYHFIQRDKITQDIISGKTFYIRKGETTTFDANAGADKEIDKNQTITLSAESIDEPATYNWYDPEGNLIYTGLDITLSPELTKQYTLEVIKNSNGLKDYDQVTVEVNPFVFGIMAPNPATNNVTISYIADEASSAYFMFTEQTTNNTYNHILDTQASQKNIDITGYTTGIYLVSLICDGNLIETKSLIIN